MIYGWALSATKHKCLEVVSRKKIRLRETQKNAIFLKSWSDNIFKGPFMGLAYRIGKKIRAKAAVVVFGIRYKRILKLILFSRDRTISNYNMNIIFLIFISLDLQIVTSQQGKHQISIWSWIQNLVQTFKRLFISCSL